MWETIFFLLTQVLTISNGYSRLKDHYQTFDWQFLISLLMISIYYPLLEEALFRVVYKQYFGISLIAGAINGIIFGLAHVVNYSHFPTRKDFILNILIISYFGYYLFQFDNYLICVIIHGYFNLTNILFSLIIANFTRSKQPLKQPIDNGIRLPKFEKRLPIPDRTVEDCDLPFRTYLYRFKSVTKLDSKIVKMHEAFDRTIDRITPQIFPFKLGPRRSFK